MAMLDEQLVDEWLNRNGYFTMRGIKDGNDEIDFLALKYQNATPEFLHVEVQISFDPTGYLGGSSNASKRTVEQIKSGVDEWVAKKFTSEKKQKMRAHICSSANWKYMLVFARFREESHVLSQLTDRNIEPISYHTVLNALSRKNKNTSSSVASDIAKLLMYAKEEVSLSATDPINNLIGAATRKIRTEAVMKMTRGKDWNKS